MGQFLKLSIFSIKGRRKEELSVSSSLSGFGGMLGWAEGSHESADCGSADVLV